MKRTQELQVSMGAGKEKKGIGSFTVGRVDAEIDGHRGDALVAARHAVRLGFNLAADFVKVVEDLAFGVKKLAVLCRMGRRARRARMNKSGKACVSTVFPNSLKVSTGMMQII